MSDIEEQDNNFVEQPVIKQEELEDDNQTENATTTTKKTKKRRTKRRPSNSLDWCVREGYIKPLQIKQLTKGDDVQYDLKELNGYELQFLENRLKKYDFTILYGVNRAIFDGDFEPEDESPSVTEEDIRWDFFVIGDAYYKGKHTKYVTIRVRDGCVFPDPSRAANEGYGPEMVDPETARPINPETNRISGYDFLHLPDRTNLTYHFCIDNRYELPKKRRGIYKTDGHYKKVNGRLVYIKNERGGRTPVMLPAGAPSKRRKVTPKQKPKYTNSEVENEDQDDFEEALNPKDKRRKKDEPTQEELAENNARLLELVEFFEEKVNVQNPQKVAEFFYDRDMNLSDLKNAPLELWNEAGVDNSVAFSAIHIFYEQQSNQSPVSTTSTTTTTTTTSSRKTKAKNPKKAPKNARKAPENNTTSYRFYQLVDNPFSIV